MADDSNQKSFWTFWASLPGVITATAGLIAAVGGLIAGLAAVGIIGGSSLSPLPTPPLTSITEPTSLSLRLGIWKRHADGTESNLQDGDVLTSEDRYGVLFEPAQESYVYVLQQDATGGTDVLFPNRQWSSQTNPIPKGMQVWVPEDIDQGFYLDENVGREVIMVVATKEPNERLESILGSLGEGREIALKNFSSSGERGVGGVKSLEKRTFSTPKGQNLQLETVLVQGQDLDFVYKIEFEHK